METDFETRPVISVLSIWRQLFGVILALSLLHTSAMADEFQDYLGRVKDQAIEQGISEEVIEKNLSGLTVDPKVMRLDRSQPEFKLTFTEYRNKVVTKERIALGRKQMEKHHAILQRVSNHYGVPAKAIVSIWGIETSYGRLTGNNDVIRSLATLGFDKRRSPQFTRELINALRILDEGHISRDKMIGSWSGAMGQSQFMPSSFLKLSQDFDDDGRKDIWTNEGDVFASIAFYLKKNGWIEGQRWGREVIVPPEQKKTLAAQLNKYSRTERHPLEYWKEMGLKRPNGTPIPVANMWAAVLMPDGVSGPAFLVYNNFRVFLSYNPSNSYALSVGYLSDSL